MRVHGQHAGIHAAHAGTGKHAARNFRILFSPTRVRPNQHPGRGLRFAIAPRGSRFAVSRAQGPSCHAIRAPRFALRRHAGVLRFAQARARGLRPDRAQRFAIRPWEGPAVCDPPIREPSSLRSAHQTAQRFAFRKRQGLGVCVSQLRGLKICAPLQGTG